MSVSVPGFPALTLSKAVFLLGFLFYLFSLFHYAWHHRYSHLYRKKLKSLENKLGIEVYRLRVRPKIGPFKFHYDWALHMIGIVYGAITASYVGLETFLMTLGVVVGAYVLRLLVSALEPTEPLET
jgi:divalent metal cation (Fe/Co/Zn/Cd) transporter